LQILQRHAPVPGVEPKRQRAARASEPGDEFQRQRLDDRDECAAQPVKQGIPSAETDFADAILKVVGAADDFDFDAHEIDRQVAPVNFGESARRPFAW
jgi:hypothetical protein